MNINALTTSIMLVHSDRWHNAPDVRAILTRRELGLALLSKVNHAHEVLAALQSRRAGAAYMLRKLTEELNLYDGHHDDFARALYFALESLIHSTRDAALKARYRDLQKLLFPRGLSVIKRSLVGKGGAMIELRGRVTPEVVELLRSTGVGAQTLLDLYDGWVEAGERLRTLSQERATLQVTLARGGSARSEVDIRAARNLWIQTARLMIDAGALMDLSAAERDSLFGPLQKSVEDAARRRAGAEPAEPGDPDDGNEDPDSGDAGPDGGDAGPDDGEGDPDGGNGGDAGPDGGEGDPEGGNGGDAGPDDGNGNPDGGDTPAGNDPVEPAANASAAAVAVENTAGAQEYVKNPPVGSAMNHASRSAGSTMPPARFRVPAASGTAPDLPPAPSPAASYQANSGTVRPDRLTRYNPLRVWSRPSCGSPWSPHSPRLRAASPATAPTCAKHCTRTRTPR